MVSDIGFPIECVIISIFIGYIYYYLHDADYHEILSWTSIKIGCVSGLLLFILAILVGLLESNAFSWDNFFCVSSDIWNSKHDTCYIISDDRRIFSSYNKTDIKEH